MKKYFKFETSIFLGVWFLLMIAGEKRLLRDPGTFWHTVVGQHILSSGHLIHKDIFSFTFYDKPWVPYEWLGECVMALIHRLAGFDGLLVVTVTLLAFQYAWFARRFKKAGINFLLIAFILALVMLSSAYHFLVRPHIVSILMLGFIFSALCDFEAGFLKIKNLFWFVPALIIWTNIHGGVAGGIGTIGLCIIGWCLMKIFMQKSPLKNYREMISLLGFLTACTLSVLVNPYGIELPKTWFTIILSPVLPHIIDEHLSIIYGGWEWILPLGIFYVALLIGTFPEKPRITWLIPIVWLVLACLRIRNGPLFAVTAAVAISDIFPHVRWVKWLSSKGSEICRISRPEPESLKLTFRHLIIPVLLIFMTAVLNVFAIRLPVLGQGWAKFDHTYWPVELLPELKNYEKTHPEGTPVFNDNLFGGFLIYYTPKLRVFIDDRFELYKDEGLLNYCESDPSKINEWSDYYGFDIALIQKGSRFEKYLLKAKEWKILKRCEAGALFQKSSINKK